MVPTQQEAEEEVEEGADNDNTDKHEDPTAVVAVAVAGGRQPCRPSEQ